MTQSQDTPGKQDKVPSDYKSANGVQKRLVALEEEAKELASSHKEAKQKFKNYLKDLNETDKQPLLQLYKEAKDKASQGSLLVSALTHLAVIYKIPSDMKNLEKKMSSFKKRLEELSADDEATLKRKRDALLEQAAQFDAKLKSRKSMNEEDLEEKTTKLLVGDTLDADDEF